MAEYTGVGQGTYNTVAGSIGAAAALFGGNGGLGGLFGGGNMATKADVENAKELAEKDATIALLKSNSETDAKMKDVYIAAAERDNNIRKEMNDEFKEIRAEMREIVEKQGAVNTEQAVFNAKADTAIGVIKNSMANIDNVLNDITKVGVRRSAICDFGGGCSGCSGNI